MLVRLKKCGNRNFILALAVIILLWPASIYASGKFRKAKRPTSKVTIWHHKSTQHFRIMYKDKYIDPEKILRELSGRFGIEPRILGVKIEVFIQRGRVYAKPGSKKVYVWDEADLRHELTHILFYQINRNAPFSIREGIAVYAQYEEPRHAPEVDVSEIIELEEELAKRSKGQGRGAVYGKADRGVIKSRMYARGYSFVAHLIKEKGIEEFKKFYKQCSGAHPTM